MAAGAIAEAADSGAFKPAQHVGAELTRSAVEAWSLPAGPATNQAGPSLSPANAP
jgi:hypothetical protein